MKHAEQITRQHATTFYFASRLLSRRIRRAAYVIYSVCRISDNTVDTADGSDRAGALACLRGNIAAAYQHTAASDSPLWREFSRIIQAHAIPRECFDTLLDGMEMDLRQNRYDSFDALDGYCYRVAGIVGVMMMHLFGYTDPRARNYAVRLGIAMQLTNILRDIKEDYHRDRIYLPQNELARLCVREEHIAQGVIDDAFVEIMKVMIARARTHYREADAGIPMIRGFRNRLTVLVMSRLYAAILTAIERAGYDVFSRRAHTTVRQKIAIAAGIPFSPTFWQAVVFRNMRG